MIDIRARNLSAGGGLPNLDFQAMDARRIQFGYGFDLVFSELGFALGGRSSGIFARRGLRPQTGRAVASFPAAARAMRRTCFWHCGPRCGTSVGANLFSPDGETLFFLRPGDYQKWLPKSGFAPRHIGLAPKDAVYDGAGKIHGMVPDHLAALHPARAGKFARGIHRRCHAALSRPNIRRMPKVKSMSAWCGWKLTR